MSVPELERAVTRPIPLVPRLIFATRWLQLPLYVGLILAQAVYVFHFWVELIHLIEAAFGDPVALQKLIASSGYRPDSSFAGGLNETIIMLAVLSLIDVVMISNLLIMVIIGGYETFVSRSEKVLIAQTVIHLAFLLSAMAVASTDRLIVGVGKAAREH